LFHFLLLDQDFLLLQKDLVVQMDQCHLMVLELQDHLLDLIGLAHQMDHFVLLPQQLLEVLLLLADQ